MTDPLKPSAALLVKLASLAVHVEEYHSPKGHKYDKAAIDTILNDVEVETWLTQMGKLGFLPAKR